LETLKHFLEQRIALQNILEIGQQQENVAQLLKRFSQRMEMRNENKDNDAGDL
jgi:hypothetical protein